jgi:hypothetical protein
VDFFAPQIRVEFAGISPVVGKIFWYLPLLNKEFSVNKMVQQTGNSCFLAAVICFQHIIFQVNTKQTGV